MLSPDPATWEGSYIAANGSALFVDGQFWYWYEAGPRSAAGIGWRARADGASLAKRAAPVLEPGPCGAGTSAASPTLRDPHRPVLLPVLPRPGPRPRGSASASRVRTDGIHWEKLRTNPMLEIGEDGAFDEHGLGEPAVWQSHGFYWMLYTGRDRRGTPPPGPGAVRAMASRGRKLPAVFAGTDSVGFAR